MSLAAVLRSEWTKIRSLRSTLWALLPAFGVGVGLAALAATSLRGRQPGGTPADPLFTAFYGLTLAQLGVVVFAVLVVGAEYGTGTIRASLLATPRRGLFYAGKVLAGTLTAAVVALVTVPAAFFTSQALLGPQGVGVEAEGAVEAMLGAFLHLTLMCAFTMGVATMLRSTVRSLGILLPVFFLGAQGLANVPALKPVAQYLPDQTAWVIMHLTGPPGDSRFARDYGAWGGVGLLVLWTAAALIGGYLVLRRNDA
ncbi:ABC transporter permease subunit [Thermostaphylospora chromogena]|uniref:ABC-type transport system involved in multi-copper enzyme maturation, permease component n=1 Tax=Thermostaphylospora chromogena TaxID=35622 RepID=A0A1H1HTK3_9ACTN|nr:ABC transporter permease subunit [Thermostaphylospora chromogena]SDR28669.1 ABC-type transport system involved in multi-copper enzyme maturation, permease component [Thermostaphylospora chromogena]